MQLVLNFLQGVGIHNHILPSALNETFQKDRVLLLVDSANGRHALMLRLGLMREMPASVCWSNLRHFIPMCTSQRLFKIPGNIVIMHSSLLRTCRPILLKAILFEMVNPVQAASYVYVNFTAILYDNISYLVTHTLEEVCQGRISQHLPLHLRFGWLSHLWRLEVGQVI